MANTNKLVITLNLTPIQDHKVCNLIYWACLTGGQIFVSKLVNWYP